jgi:DNA-binding transcriptional ArsR family regulator
MADTSEILKVLANPVRVSFLAWLREPQRYFSGQTHPLSMGISANQFEKKSGLSQSTVSAHLSALEKAGLLRSNRVGQWAFYSRDEEKIGLFLSQLKAML